MEVQIALPPIGEDDITQATLAFWLIKEGDTVDQGQDLIELTTDKAAFTLPSPQSGRLIRRLRNEGDTIAVGDALCVMEV